MNIRRLARTGSDLSAQGQSVVRWGKRGFWAIMDQGLTATANFLLSIVLARWMTESAYGSFAVAYSILLLLGTVHTALLTEPLLVFAQGRYARRPRSYLGFASRAHWLITAAEAGVVLVAVPVLAYFGQAHLARSMLAIALCAPFFLFSWLARRAAIAYLRPGLAALGSAVYLVVLVGGLAAFRALALVREDTAFLLMAVAGGVSALVVMVALKSSAKQSAPAPGRYARSAALRHWQYGRWALVTALLSWLPGNIYFLVLPIWNGLGSSAALRALLNLTTPMMHALNALGTLIIPALSQRGRRTGSFRLPPALVLAFAVLPVGYWLCLGLFGPQILDWLYDGRYSEAAGSLWVLGLLPPLTGLIALLGAELRAQERPDLVSYAYIPAAVLACTAGIALAMVGGVGGAAIGWVLAYVVIAVSLRVLIRRVGRRA